MAAKTPTAEVESGSPNLEILHFSDIDDGDTYTSDKILNIQGVSITPNRDNAATDSWGATFSGQVVTFELVGTTSNVPMTVFVFG